jgi:hypothetical protein
MHAYIYEFMLKNIIFVILLYTYIFKIDFIHLNLKFKSYTCMYMKDVFIKIANNNS